MTVVTSSSSEVWDEKFGSAPWQAQNVVDAGKWLPCVMGPVVERDVQSSRHNHWEARHCQAVLPRTHVSQPENQRDDRHEVDVILWYQH